MLVTMLRRSGRFTFAGDIGGPACARAAEASKAANMSFVFMADGRVGLCWLDLNLIQETTPRWLTQRGAPEVLL